jgi:FSR family fosmidomycin resistance protein-like MFS transporter
MLGHFMNDLFPGLLPTLNPLFKEQFHLTKTEVGLIPLAFSGVASLSQPLFGHLLDKHQRRWFASATLIWSGAFAAIYAFAPSFPVLLGLIALAGISSGAYHPLGATGAAQATGDRERQLAMSIYSVGGAGGYALGAVVAVALLGSFGLHGLVILIVPAALTAVFIYTELGRLDGPHRARQRRVTSGKIDLGPLALVVLVTLLRFWAFNSVFQFVSIWYDELGYTREFYGPLLMTIIIAGIFGTLAGGVLADRVGQRRFVAITLLASIPTLLIFVGFPGPIAFFTGSLFALFCDATISVTLVMAQRMMPGRLGMASGVILGLSFVGGAIGAPITGALADRIGTQPALMSLSIMLLASAVIASLLPRAVELTGARAGESDDRVGLGDDPVVAPVGHVARR